VRRSPDSTSPQTTDADEEFELVRQSFLARLTLEMERLVALAGELEAAKTECSSVLKDITTFAHRLRGAAAVFDERDLSIAARSAELAATMVLDEAGTNIDIRVWSTLRALAASLVHIIGNDASSRMLALESADPKLAA
jgi:hypothetical protein